MSDPTSIRLRGNIGENFPPTGQCIWCGTVCWTLAATPFRPDLGEVPLHLFCSAALREAYAAWRQGVPIRADLADGMRRMARTMSEWPALAPGGVTP